MKALLYLLLGLVVVLGVFIVISAIMFAIQLLIWVVGVALVIWIIVEIAKYYNKEKDKPPE